MRPIRRNVLFTFVLFCFVFFIFLKTLDMGRVAGMVPKTVVLFTVVMLIVQLTIDIFHINVKNTVPYNNELKREKDSPAKDDFRSNSIGE